MAYIYVYNISKTTFETILRELIIFQFLILKCVYLSSPWISELWDKTVRWAFLLHPPNLSFMRPSPLEIESASSHHGSRKSPPPNTHLEPVSAFPKRQLVIQKVSHKTQEVRTLSHPSPAQGRFVNRVTS